ALPRAGTRTGERSASGPSGRTSRKPPQGSTTGRASWCAVTATRMPWRTHGRRARAASAARLLGPGNVDAHVTRTVLRTHHRQPAHAAARRSIGETELQNTCFRVGIDRDQLGVLGMLG